MYSLEPKRSFSFTLISSVHLMFRTLFVSAIALVVLMSASPKPESALYNIKVQDIIGNKVSMSRYKGKVLLIVNVASRCVNTPQYEDLQTIYEEYEDDGLVVMGFPSNDFFNQEPGTNQEINRFCTSKYGVTFPMFSKVSVKGTQMHPLYQYLTKKKINGRLNAPVKWNFQKFLVGRNGKVLKVFGPNERVYEAAIKAAIRKHIKE